MSIGLPGSMPAGYDDEEDDVYNDISRVDAVLREGGRAVADLGGSEFTFDEPPIIPFNLSATQHLQLHADEVEEEASLFDISPEAMSTLKEECGSYIDNLEMTLTDTFSRENRKTKRRMKDTKSIPLSFLYMRTIQAALKQTGSLDIQREKRVLFNLQELYEIAE